MRTYTAHAGTGELQVTLEATHADGGGLACFLYGGTRPHVGGQALAAPGAVVHGEQLTHCDLWTATVPGHKDVEAATLVARELCLACNEPVSVTAGIHVDHATTQQIEELMHNCHTTVEHLRSQLEQK